MDIKTDFLIVGGGIAGLRAAIGASRYGKVVILNKGIKGESCSEFAQGGIAAVLNDEEGGIQSHYQDTLDAGKGLCRENAVKVLVEEGPRRIHELLDWGAEFDKDGETFAYAREGAHRHNRILRARGDSTGNEIVKTLVKTIGANKNITIVNGQFTDNLLVSRGHSEKVCFGAWVLDEREKEWRRFFANAVILATGGAGQVYKRTTNPPVSTGDGIGMALRAGAELEDMEFFQFHPTALFLPAAPSFLLSEAMRGEGGRLLDEDEKPFMDRYHPDAELAPRDLVTRAIVSEIEKMRRRHVFLDMTRLDPFFVKKRFPKIYATCLRFGIDITSDKIPVAPSAHYMMGGIKTDLSGRTNIAGLYAVGEVASTGVHGANRLASNSLLEGLVFGARVGDAVGSEASERQIDSHHLGDTMQMNAWGGSTRAPETYLLVQKQLREVMWRRVGIVRSESSLRIAADACRKWEDILKRPGSSRLAFETRNMLCCASAMMESALQRRESVGAHYREDCPEGGEQKTFRHILLTQTSLSQAFLERSS
ncbi:MAG: L-aspartate oxidase [Nitrospiria bacterium]